MQLFKHFYSEKRLVVRNGDRRCKLMSLFVLWQQRWNVSLRSLIKMQNGFPSKYDTAADR